MKKLILWYLIVLSVLTLTSSVMLRVIWPEHYASLLFLIPLFYVLMLGIMVWLKRINEKKGKDPSIFFLSFRIVKILLSIIFLLVYFSAVSTQLVTFAVVFAVFYLCLSAIETTMFIKGEKKS